MQNRNADLAPVLLLLLITLLISACGSSPRFTPAGTAEIRDGAPEGPIDISKIPDAIPKSEPITKAGNKSPYTIAGKTYEVMPSNVGYRASGKASWYGTKFHGRKTSNGEDYNVYRMTAAHKTLPIPSYVRVTNLENNRQAIVRINDRGPFHGDRIIDLSYAAALKLGYADKGTALVQVEAIDTSQYQTEPMSKPVPPLLVKSDDPNPPLLAKNNTQDPPPAGKGSHYLQAGAFQSQQAALNLQQRLQEFTRERVFVEPPDAGQSFYRVRIGPLISLAMAQQLRDSLQSARLAVPYLIHR